jgi:hypothetical protein
MQHARGEMRNAYSILVGKPHGEKTFTETQARDGKAVGVQLERISVTQGREQ